MNYQIKELEFKNSNEIKNINMQKNAENSIIDILLSQENFMKLTESVFNFCSLINSFLSKL